MTDTAPNRVRVEYLIAIRRDAETSGLDIVVRALAEALDRHWEEGAAHRAWEFVREEFRRVAGPKDPPTCNLAGPTLYGFQIQLPEEVESPSLIIKNVTEALRSDADVQHVSKFHDSLVEERNLGLARELFTLEMRLRRAITLIYLHAYGGTYYDLLRNDALGADSACRKRMPKAEDLNTQGENEFFYLLFNHYGELNVLRQTRQIDDLIKQLGASADFATLQRELQRLPVEDADDREFLNRIKKALKPAEDLRNCVMHNRAPTDTAIANYETARDSLNEAMDEFFDRSSITRADDDEMPWDTAAREAVEDALECADWDVEAKTITLHHACEDRMDKTVASREELEDELRTLASDAFYTNCSRDDGEYIADCDEYGIVEDALADYEDRLETFFAKGDEEAGGN